MTKISDKRLAEMIVSAENHGEAGFSYVHTKDYIIALKELTALRAHNSDSAEPVAVKPLEWSSVETKIQKLFLCFEAKSVVGRYCIEDMGDHRADDRWWLQLNDVLSKHPTPERAKAAAQADYETRIRSAIASPPAKEVDIRIKAFEEALTPSAETKAEYIGEFQFTVTMMELDDSDEPFEVQNMVTVPWTTIKEIMQAIRSRALTNRTPDDEVGNG